MIPAISDIRAHEILDSRGQPTLSVTVILIDCTVATAAVPSGASTGEREAIELRDGDPARYNGRGVLKAVVAIRDVIAPRVRGMNVTEQGKIDLLLRQLDGTPNKSRLGANAVLGVSLAVARAAAGTQGLPLYSYIAGLSGLSSHGGESTAYVLPAPMIAVLNGGSHANNTLDVQEFMLFPLGAPTFAEAVRWGAEIFHALKLLLERHGFSTAVGDAGGYAPNLKSPEQALTLLVEAIETAGFRPGEDVALAMDLAASELFDHGGYIFKHAGSSRRSADRLIEIYRGWQKQFPLVSLEDGMDEHDRAGWQQLTRALGKKLQLVGDDVFVTNPALLSAGVKDGVGNAILIKPNQIGTLSETLQTIRLAKDAGYAWIISGRSGETEDSFIADLAVGTAAGQIKTGSLCRSERLAKYNRLLTIERELGVYAVYGGKLLRQRQNGGKS